MKRTVLLVVTMLPALTACVCDETLEENPKHPNVEEVLTIRVENGEVSTRSLDDDEEECLIHHAFMDFHLTIRNEQEGMYLEVEGIRLCNVHASGNFRYIGTLENGYWMLDEKLDTLSFDFKSIGVSFGEEVVNPQGHSLSIIPQSTRSWNPNQPIDSTTGSFLLLDCRIFSVFDTDKESQEGKENLVWSDAEGKTKELAVPLVLSGKSGDTMVCTLEMKSDCDWYCTDGAHSQKIFEAITFSPTVDDWNVQDINL